MPLSVARLHHRHQRYLQPSSRRSCCKPFTRTSLTEAAMASHVCEVRFTLLWHAASLGVTHACAQSFATRRHWHVLSRYSIAPSRAKPTSLVSYTWNKARCV